MDSTKWISKKIALLGSHAVGKTSLISRFVYQKFSDKYLTTIGLKVDKKSIEFDEHKLDLVIWDIAGRDNTSEVPYYYLKGCTGIIYVVDSTRASTFQQVDKRIQELKDMIPDVEIILAANKADLFLAEGAELTDAALAESDEFAETLAAMPRKPDYITSAKTGGYVEDMFLGLAKRMISLKEEDE